MREPSNVFPIKKARNEKTGSWNIKYSSKKRVRLVVLVADNMNNLDYRRVLNSNIPYDNLKIRSTDKGRFSMDTNTKRRDLNCPQGVSQL